MSAILHNLRNHFCNRKIYHNAKFLPLLIKFSPSLASIYLYRRHTGKLLNLRNPRDYNEKLNWLKLYWQHPLLVKCADKYEVRDYIIKCGCKEILNDLYGVYKDVSTINWDALPNKFVIKTTNSWSTNIICRDKEKFNKDEVFRILEDWLKVNHSLKKAEMYYSKITPRIICEKYLEPENGFLPIELSIYCFNGEPKIAHMKLESINNQNQRHFVDLNWNEISILKAHDTDLAIPPKPKTFDKMIMYSKIISKGFPFVRIDFYDYRGKPILGEMTFTPQAGLITSYREDALKMLGEWIELPDKYIR